MTFMYILYYVYCVYLLMSYSCKMSLLARAQIATGMRCGTHVKNAAAAKEGGENATTTPAVHVSHVAVQTKQRPLPLSSVLYLLLNLFLSACLFFVSISVTMAGQHC